MDPQYWDDCGTYWLNKHAQGTPGWFGIRKGRLTASNFGAAIGRSQFSTPEDLALEMAGLKVKEFSESSKIAMAHGSKTESTARDWYCNTRRLRVIETGMACPKWEPRIGGSPDGVILDSEGLIEIKCPFTMYQPILKHVENKERGDNPSQQDPFYHDHIWDSHYCQMQGCMKIMDKKFCDYIVYSTEDRKVFVDRVLFNPEFWDNVLYPGLKSFLDNVYTPLLQDH